MSDRHRPSRRTPVPAENEARQQPTRADAHQSPPKAKSDRNPPGATHTDHRLKASAQPWHAHRSSPEAKPDRDPPEPTRTPSPCGRGSVTTVRQALARTPMPAGRGSATASHPVPAGTPIPAGSEAGQPAIRLWHPRRFATEMKRDNRPSVSGTRADRRRKLGGKAVHLAVRAGRSCRWPGVLARLSAVQEKMMSSVRWAGVGGFGGVVEWRRPGWWAGPSRCRGRGQARERGRQHFLYLRPEPHQQAALRSGGQESRAVPVESLRA
jgi:hypothetical protein